ncbi:hypothetical protein AAFF_G00323780 [Aldrovandia affinis]|uniref:Uncharacterized protein n=1 Tax=Aldrovandia affinis TaxID=143900 RepID=A0AAD7R7G2_9TELE|nr:hypothetical protein AAFF_G00323780 [Aldrovandia affinis]
MEEPSAASKPVSPYSGYNGQIRSCVYQPTELALITKGLTSRMDLSHDSAPPWVTSASHPHNSGSSTARADEGRPVPGLPRASSGNHMRAQW